MFKSKWGLNMNKIYDITAVGESLIDVVVKRDNSGGLSMEGNPGGAPLNAMAAATKLGCSAAFIGKLSTDSFGRLLLDTIRSSGISDEGVVFTNSEPTTLAIVTLDSRGDRSFSFYREHTADVELQSSEINLDLIKRSCILHFGSVSMTCEPSRSATLSAAKFAKENGVLVSYDPNLRERLWDNLGEARMVILEGMELADIVKVSEEELLFLTGTDDITAGAKRLMERYSMKILAVTLGAKGAIVFGNGICSAQPTYDKVKTIDTTGAGDAFWGAFLRCVVKSEKSITELTQEDLESFLDFANAAGSISTTKLGAIPALPTVAEVEKLQRQGK
jgi:fructokinase